MAIVDFTPPREPATGWGWKAAARVDRVEFEGGYSQRSSPGPNPVSRNPTLTWPGLTEAQAEAIDDFLAARGGADAIRYQPPGWSAAALFTCASWDVRETARDVYTVTASFVQEFDLG